MQIIDSNKELMSISRFLQYMRCPALYKAIYIDKSVPRTFNLHAHIGSTVHAGHEFICSQLINFETFPELIDVRAAAKDYWDDKIQDVPELLEDILEAERQAYKLVDVYYTYFKESGITPQFTEKKAIWYPQGYDFGLQGIIDRINTDGHICDLKTSSKSPSKSRNSGEYSTPSSSGYDLQMDTYFMLARESLNIDVPGGSFEYIVKTKTPKVVRVDYALEEARMRSTLDLMAKLYDSIQKGNFPPNRLGSFCSPSMCPNWGPCTGL